MTDLEEFFHYQKNKVSQEFGDEPLGAEIKMEIGRLCVKLAGRDAGRLCIVVDDLEKNFVLIDGNVRRRKCNALHLEPLNEVIKIKKGASHADVVAEFKKLKLDVWNTKPKKVAAKKLQIRKQPNANKKATSEKKETKEVKAEKPAEKKVVKKTVSKEKKA